MQNVLYTSQEIFYKIQAIRKDCTNIYMYVYLFLLRGTES